MPLQKRAIDVSRQLARKIFDEVLDLTVKLRPLCRNKNAQSRYHTHLSNTSFDYLLRLAAGELNLAPCKRTNVK